MKPLLFSIEINAPKARVHQLMLADKTYREWTSVFAEGSYFQGSWELGTQMLFTNSDAGSGMSARIAAHRSAEFVSIELLGMLNNGVPDTTNPLQGAFENYTYTEKDGITTLQVELEGLPAEWSEYLNAAWPKGLEKLKAICER
ncbi:MAG: hypothetical protein ABL858_03395 [Candidatus Nitrotoga sp.]